MKNVKNVSTIALDLKSYGGKGELILAPPSLRKLIDMRNKVAKVKASSAGTTMDVEVGDMELMSVLTYVRSAPFKTDMESFLEYCDGLEEKEAGISVRLYDDMRLAIESIDKGECNPLELSVDTTTPKSD